ncbi:MAG: dsRBD fold-containing protein [Micromonosporaceae bacterium]
MSKLDHWSAELAIDEHDGETHAEARLVMKEDHQLSGSGTARRNPADPDVTEIGEEIAVARALSDLAHKLLAAAATEIEAVTHERARLHL